MTIVPFRWRVFCTWNHFRQSLMLTNLTTVGFGVIRKTGIERENYLWEMVFGPRKIRMKFPAGFSRFIFSKDGRWSTKDIIPFLGVELNWKLKETTKAGFLSIKVLEEKASEDNEYDIKVKSFLQWKWNIFIRNTRLLGDVRFVGAPPIIYWKIWCWYWQLDVASSHWRFLTLFRVLWLMLKQANKRV